MSETSTRTPVKGSERVSLHGARAAGPVPNDERFCYDGGYGCNCVNTCIE